MNKFVVRVANVEDCLPIMKLIQELADYEEMPDGPKLKQENFKVDGFGERSFYKCLVAEISTNLAKETVGYCLYFYTYSLWIGKSIYMEDLYVTPKYRHLGIGTSMWKELVKEGLEKGCQMTNFSVLGWNTPSIEFYKNKKAYDRTEDEKVHLLRINHDCMNKFIMSKHN